MTVSVDQQDFDAAGFRVVAGAGGLLGLAQDDALRGDALCDEGIAHAKGAALGQIAVEVDVAGGIVIASQQDTAALGGLQGLDHGGDGLLCVGGKGSRGGLEVDGARGLCGSGLLKGNELFVDGFCLGGGGCVLGCSGGSGFLIRGAGALAMACGARGNRRGGGGRGCDIICTIGAFQDPDDDGNEQVRVEVSSSSGFMMDPC